MIFLKPEGSLRRLAGWKRAGEEANPIIRSILENRKDLYIKEKLRILKLEGFEVKAVLKQKAQGALFYCPFFTQYL